MLQFIAKAIWKFLVVTLLLLLFENFYCENVGSSKMSRIVSATRLNAYEIEQRSFFSINPSRFGLEDTVFRSDSAQTVSEISSFP
jgi:hypothetical protein